ncbi:MAG: lipid-A-disaccharide synthase-related protein [Kastovskya adunca ATA6-11-RM4]|nr:lipid-A-disaccharide synthase-related protein [Kastovskya adunca ATA6-11-RM4]
MQLLCLSNGHGEDAIAVRICQELQLHKTAPELVALPLVGEGYAYSQLGIPIIGPVQTMPSGGFIYMEGQQLLRDVRGGLLQLTLAQFKAVRRWSKQGGVVLAVGDIVPLLFAWLSGADYAFVGTAKSEYYLRDEAGRLPNRPALEGWSGSVYHPWERWLMSQRRCKAVFPRDTLTAETLQQWSIPAFDLGNPMMDGIELDNSAPIFYQPDAEIKELQRSLVVTLLPGSRPPEAEENWKVIIRAVAELLDSFSERSLLFLGAIAPALSFDQLRRVLEAYGWHQQAKVASNTEVEDPEAIAFTQKNATLVLTKNAYNDCLIKADLAIAMAGTATEQFVGLGKPAIAIPGKGPQFTPAFAEAQTRLLGPSLVLVQEPAAVAATVHSLLRDPDRLHLIAENGRRRLGKPGAAKRIADCLIKGFGKEHR